MSVCRVQPTIPYFTENGMPNTHQQQSSSNKTHIDTLTIAYAVGLNTYAKYL